MLETNPSAMWSRDYSSFDETSSYSKERTVSSFVVPQPDNPMSPFQQYIAISKYARFMPENKRRESWDETVARYCDYFSNKFPNFPRDKIYDAVVNLKVMPSMRALMTAGPALDRDNAAGFNCSFMAINHQRCFDEAMYLLMCGSGVGFSVERQHVNKLPEISDEINNSNTVIKVKDSRIGWASAFRELITLLYSGTEPKWDLSELRPAGAPLKTFGGRSCLTGDTIVYKDRKKTQGFNEITIKELFKIQEREKNGKYRGRFKKIKLRSLDEKTGTFFRNQLIGVVDNGKADVYEILTEKGYRIKATMNHRFMKSDGNYALLEDFEEGDLIAVNGSTELKTGTCIDCEKAISRRAIRCKSCFDETQKKEDCSDITVRQRKEVKDYRAKHICCELCNISEEDVELEVHHRDGNPWNDDEENFLVVCRKCHRAEDMSRTLIGNAYSCRYLHYDKIISIKHKGIKKVYDLQMEGPNHNFIANGYVSHNSGPKPLDDLFKFTCRIFRNAAGRKLNSIECHDIMCKVGDIVVSGGVRRSALISLSNLSDDRLRAAKSGQWWATEPQRALSNNSVAYTEKPDMQRFMQEWFSLYESKSGERGIFNRTAAKNKIKSLNGRRKYQNEKEEEYDFGCNPCAEIVLRDCEFCNLTEVVIRENDTLEDLLRKVEIAAIMGTHQASLTKFRYIRSIWRKNTEEEALLGVSLTGIMDHPILSKASEETKTWLKSMKEHAVKTNIEWAEKLGINPAAAVTTVKPSGTVSLLVESGSGIHGRLAPYYIRTVRNDKKDPLSDFMIAQGIPHETDQMKESNWVFSFPVKAPASSRMASDMSAIEQLEHYMLFNEYWAEHNVSITVYVREHEWMETGAWVYKNFDRINGIAFLPYSDHIYPQAPIQPISETAYQELVSTFPIVDFAEYNTDEHEDFGTSAKTLACSGDVCTIA